MPIFLDFKASILAVKTMKEQIPAQWTCIGIIGEYYEKFVKLFKNKLERVANTSTKNVISKPGPPEAN